MTEDEWEEFYNDLSEQLNRDYPDLCERTLSYSSLLTGIDQIGIR